MDLIFCAGNSKPKCCIAHSLGFLYGIRSDCTPCQNHPVTFVDFNWKNADWEKHVEVIKEYQPKYTIVPDIEKAEQLPDVLCKAKSIEGYTENIIFVPKVDVINEIPDRYMLGYSVPTKYGGCNISTDRFKGRRAHLLGGSPQKQYNIYLNLKDEVVSIDGNSYERAAQFGDYWSHQKRGWENSEYSGPGHYLHNFTRSCLEIREFWWKVEEGIVTETQMTMF